jgi:hypothetical protein
MSTFADTVKVMPNVTMRELKQNPSAVIEKVLARRVHFDVTAHGHPTGVVLAVAGTPTASMGTDPELTARIDAACELATDEAERSTFAHFSAAQLASRSTEEEW